MITPELIDFVKGEVGRGETRESIRNKLIAQGWTDTDVMEAFNASAPAHDLPLRMPGTSSPLHHDDIISDLPAKSHKKGLLYIIIAVVIIVAVGIFGYASGYFVSLEKVFSKSIQSSFNNTGATSDVHVTIDYSGLKEAESVSQFLPGASSTFDFGVKGAYDNQDKANLKSTASLSFKSGTIEAGVDIRVANGSMYVSLTKAPDIKFFSLKPFENKWVVFPYTSKSGDALNSPLSSITGTGTNPFSTLTDDQKQHIADITSKASFIKVTSKHLPEVVDGTLAIHFDFDLDRAGIIKYLKDVAVYLKTIDGNSDIIPTDDTDLSKGFDYLKNFHGEAWIGMFDHLPRKTTISFDASDPNTPADGVVKVMFSVAYSNWNKPVVVEVPKDAVTIDQLMKSIEGESPVYDGSTTSTTPTNNSDMEAARLKGLDASKKSILSSMRAHAELFYDNNATSYKGFCSSKGEYGAYSLAIQLPKNSVYKCNDSLAAWAAWVKLSDGVNYWCVDSTGTSTGFGGPAPTGTACPLQPIM